MLFKILTWLSGGVLDKLLGFARASMDSATARERIKASILISAIRAEMAARENAREIRLATAHFPEMRLLTFAIALPFVVHLWLVALDTCFNLGWGIPKFPYPFDEWEGAILLSFFGVYVGLGVVQSIAVAVGRRIASR